MQVNCLNSLLLVSASFFALAGVTGICGGIMYGTSRMFSSLANTHLARSNKSHAIIKKLDSKLEGLRQGSADRSKLMEGMALIVFYLTGGLAAPGFVFLFLSSIEACRTYLNNYGNIPPEPEPPPSEPSEDMGSLGSAECCNTTCCQDSDICCAITCATPAPNCCCPDVCCPDSD